MAEEREQLRISAELDTSKLKQQAQQGMQSVVNEEKKVEQQSKQTSKAIDAIGQSGKNAGQALQQAGSQGTQAMKQIGQEADKTVQKIDEIARATKNINYGHALGAAARIAGSDFGKGIGGLIGDSIGMSGDAQGLAGGAITGALGGAASMAWAGGPGMAAGALIGAASGLLNAAQEQRKAADMQIQAARENLTKREGIARSEIKAYRREQDLELANKNYNIAKNAIAGMGKEELADKEAKLGEMRNDQQALIDKTKSQIEGYIKVAEESPGTLASVGEKIAELREKLAEQQEAMKYLDSIQGLIDARKTQLSKPNTTKTEKNTADTTYLKNEVKHHQAELKDQESFMGRVSNVKLTDSLTKMGGGSGYGVQMQGINSYVSKMSGNVANIKTTIEKCLTTIQEIENKVSPYGGQFVGENE